MTTTQNGQHLANLIAVRDDLYEQWLQKEIELRLAQEQHEFLRQQLQTASQNIARIEREHGQLLQAAQRASGDVNDYRIEQALANRRQGNVS